MERIITMALLRAYLREHIAEATAHRRDEPDSSLLARVAAWLLWDRTARILDDGAGTVLVWRAGTRRAERIAVDAAALAFVARLDTLPSPRVSCAAALALLDGPTARREVA